ncbi:hypothetical protein NUACC21_53350 [Scytonema sp. NUACC21]
MTAIKGLRARLPQDGGELDDPDGADVKDDVKPQTSPETDELKAILDQAARPRARWGLRLLGLVAVAGLAYGAYLWSAGGTTVSYTTAEVKPGDLTVIVTATGSVEPTVQVDVSSEQSPKQWQNCAAPLPRRLRYLLRAH